MSSSSLSGVVRECWASTSWLLISMKERRTWSLETPQSLPTPLIRGSNNLMTAPRSFREKNRSRPNTTVRASSTRAPH